MELSDEQRLIVAHPLGSHARVLAVAGSGKTTTMAHRVVHLLHEEGLHPDEIQVLMFNREARAVFREELQKLALELGDPKIDNVRVNTFNSIGKRMYDHVWERLGFKLMADNQDRDRIIYQLKKIGRGAGFSDTEPYDASLAFDMINYWKSMLVPPEAAKSTRDKRYVEVYRRYEAWLAEERRYNYADQLYRPLLNLADIESNIPFVDNIRALIVDEYQDINFAQCGLVKLYENRDADIMAVGDDDQCIYEWRGAVPDYLLNFSTQFDRKPLHTYPLSRTFRFGPQLAQAANNLIHFNNVRTPKILRSHYCQRRPGFKPTAIEVAADSKEIADQVSRWLSQPGVEPKHVAVLSRTYSQLGDLGFQFLARKIPFFIEHEVNFWCLREVEDLLAYARTVAWFGRPLNKGSREALTRIINKPNRYIGAQQFEEYLHRATDSPRAAIARLADSENLNDSQKENIRNFQKSLEACAQYAAHEDVTMGQLLRRLYQDTGYAGYFSDWYGTNEVATAKIKNVELFIGWALDISIRANDYDGFKNYLGKLDPTCGKPKEQCIRFTSIHKTKGRQWRFVILPDCTDGLCPILSEGDLGVVLHDKIPKPSPFLEAERRVFYVGLTRATESVVLSPDPWQEVEGDGPLPSRFLYEAQLGERSVVATFVREAVGADDLDSALAACQTYAQGDSGAASGLSKLKRTYAKGAANADQGKAVFVPKQSVYPHPYRDVQSRRVNAALENKRIFLPTKFDISYGEDEMNDDRIALKSK